MEEECSVDVVVVVIVEGRKKHEENKQKESGLRRVKGI